MTTNDIETRHWRLQHNDVQSLGHKVPGFDARHYYDQQEALAAQHAATRWPRLAQWLHYGEAAARGARTEGHAGETGGGIATPATSPAAR